MAVTPAISTRGKLIAFEGIDGSGKTSHAMLFAQRLKQQGIICRQTAEPTKLPAGMLAREIMSGSSKADPCVVAALFAADRLDHIHNAEQGILKQIEQGINVITDRYYFSSYAYQSIEVPIDWLIAINSLAAQALRPDATIFIDILPEEAMRRISKAHRKIEIYENEERLNLVRARYFEAFNMLKSQECIICVDGAGSLEEVSKRVWDKTAYLFE